jgi:hypothetical protein
LGAIWKTLFCASWKPSCWSWAPDFLSSLRQKRIQLDGDDFYIDLLFYNRKLKRLVELKQGSFKPEYKGQMELYLRWLALHEREPEENLPLNRGQQPRCCS